jgi:hypothetical protein
MTYSRIIAEIDAFLLPERTRESVTAHRRAIELRPEYPEAYNNLAVSLAEQGRLCESNGTRSYRQEDLHRRTF